MNLGDTYPTYDERNKYREAERIHRDAVFTLINKAFNRCYGEEDVLEMRPRGVMYVKSDKVRRYDFIPVGKNCGTRMACLTESEVTSDNNVNKITCNGDTIWVEMCDMALIRPVCVKSAMDSVKCVIDSPGGTIDYRVNVVTVDENDYSFYSLHKCLSEETLSAVDEHVR